MERHHMILLVSAAFTAIFISESTTLATFVVSPSNQAVSLYYSTTLNCTSDTTLSADIEWFFTPVGNDSEISLGSCLADSPADLEGYEFDTADPFSCNLILVNTTSEVAGTYSCASQSEESVLADVIFLHSRPLCTVNGELKHNLSIIYITEGDYEFLIVCSMNFTGPQNFIPAMNWTTSSTVLNSSEELTDSSLTSSLDIELYYIPSGVSVLTWFTQNPDVSQLPVGLNPEPPQLNDTWTVLFNEYTPLPNVDCGGCSCVACYVPVIVGCIVAVVVISLSVFCIVKRVNKKSDTVVYSQENEGGDIEMDVKF